MKQLNKKLDELTKTVVKLIKLGLEIETLVTIIKLIIKAIR
ncbi:hypothetical protein HMPREF1872_00773 [Amygdalobacter nucleatus]|uniref:Uncharacterized protein n=1 Tax=Amygdalobacter nucleatus TaxID=3029274 RepID=A0A133YCS0_9FIRM|nr:hypothetical protein HMPREF1872_00773 [Amygdalobacter nucleatus]